MQCPVCKETQLLMTNREEIEIDYCPTCRGVWLDRGELDKIVERSQREHPGQAAQSQALIRGRDDYRDDVGHGGGRHGSSHKAGRHGGFLKRLFDGPT